MFTRKNVTEWAAAALIFLFLYTGFSKYFEFAKFHRVIGQSPLIKNFAGVVAYTLPGLEILIAILLITPQKRSLGFTLSLILMSLFTFYLIYMVIFTPNLPCSCGGVLKQLTWTQHIFFNLAFVGIAWTGRKMQNRVLLDIGNSKTTAIVYTN